MSCRTSTAVEDPLGLMTRSVDLESEFSHTRHLMGFLEATENNGNGTDDQSRMLSLSLNSPMLGPNQYGDVRPRNFNSDFVNPSDLAIPRGARAACHVNNSGYAFAVPSPLPSSIGNSRYLRPAQMFLEEAVSVCDNLGGIPSDKLCRRKQEFVRFVLDDKIEIQADLCGSEAISDDKIKIHAKSVKLISLPEEFEARFENYCHQMEEVVTLFEAVAGLGAAKSYTALALQAMLKHFCNLRLAIASQIKITRLKLFDNDASRIGSGLSRLSLLHQDTRQKRFSIPQLRLIQGQQRQAWRPIRGVPETSVVILHAWLFKHFLRPYQNDSKKLILASQTGLSKNQPMIEEMYEEEFADSSPLVIRSLVGGDDDDMADGRS